MFNLRDGTDRLSQNVGNNLPKFTAVKNTLGGQNIEEDTKYWHPGNKENCSSNYRKNTTIEGKKHHTEYNIVEPDQQK